MEMYSLEKARGEAQIIQEKARDLSADKNKTGEPSNEEYETAEALFDGLKETLQDFKYSNLPDYNYQRGLDELLESNTELSDSDIERFAYNFWIHYLIDDVKGNNKGIKEQSIEDGFRNFIAIAGDWAIHSSLKDFANKKGWIFKDIIEKSLSPNIRVLTDLKSQRPEMIPDNFEESLRFVSSRANDDFKANLMMLLGDDDLAEIANSK